MEEMQYADPNMKKSMDNKQLCDIDTTTSVLQAKDDFNRIQAMMKKVVASGDEFIHEVQEGLPTELQVYHTIGVNMKIRVHEKPAPLTINFSYPENPNIKNV